MFQEHIRGLEEAERQEKEREKEARRRQERRNRDAFRQLLQQHRCVLLREDCVRDEGLCLYILGWRGRAVYCGRMFKCYFVCGQKTTRIIACNYLFSVCPHISAHTTTHSSTQMAIN